MDKNFYSEEFYSKKFSGETMKKAYMNAVKWLASYVISKKELSSVTYNFEKLEEDSVSSVIVHLYATVDEDKLEERHCKICKETHSQFFISEETNCNWCKLKAYHRRKDEAITNKRKYCQEVLSKEGEW